MGLSVYEEVKANGLLPVTLHGVKTLLEKELGISPIMIATDETIKGEWARQGHTEYPHAHLELNEIMTVRDQTSNRAIQRLGINSGLNGSTFATTRRGYVFPVTVGMVLKYAGSDPLEFVYMAEALAILSGLGGLFFTVNFNEDFNYQVRIEIPDNMSIPLANTTDAAQPGGQEIEVNLIVHTLAGFFRDIAAVNSDKPKTEYTITNTGYGRGQDDND